MSKDITEHMSEFVSEHLSEFQSSISIDPMSRAYLAVGITQSRDICFNHALRHPSATIKTDSYIDTQICQDHCNQLASDCNLVRLSVPCQFHPSHPEVHFHLQVLTAASCDSRRLGRKRARPSRRGLQGGRVPQSEKAMPICLFMIHGYNLLYL